MFLNDRTKRNNRDEEPETKIAFPIYLNIDSEWRRLIGLGARQVSFLNINVYVVGLYMRAQDIETLRTLNGWKVTTFSSIERITSDIAS